MRAEGESCRPRSIAATLLAERRSRFALAVVPTGLRASVEGDLSEQLETRVVPELGVVGARRWLYAELARSAPAMLRHRLLGGTAEARRRRLRCAGVIFALQATLLVCETGGRDLPLLLLALFAAGLIAPLVSLLLDATSTTVAVVGNLGVFFAFLTTVLDRDAFDLHSYWHFVFPGLYAMGTRDGMWRERRNRSKRAAR